MPTLPAATVDTTPPTQLGATVTASNCADIQTRINAANLGDTIVIPHTFDCTVGLTTPNKLTGTGWILIKSDQDNLLPAYGSRVSSADYSKMPILRGNAFNTPVLLPAASSHHYRFQGFTSGEHDRQHGQSDRLYDLHSGAPSTTTFSTDAISRHRERLYFTSGVYGLQYGVRRERHAEFMSGSDSQATPRSGPALQGRQQLLGRSGREFHLWRQLCQGSAASQAISPSPGTTSTSR